MTEIHAAVPSSLAAEVREAQMRGEDKATESLQKDTKPEALSKGKERVKGTPAGPKVQRSAEDVENTRRRGETTEPTSDPESDWIPGPNGATKTAAAKQEDNALGTKGPGDNMQLDTPPKRNLPKAQAANSDEKDERGSADPLVTVMSKRTVPTQTFNLRVPSNPISASQVGEMASTDTPDLLKSSRNSFSAVQPKNQDHPLLREFSYSWEDSELLHDTGLIKSEEGKAGVKKRLASDEFEQKKAWELKMFKKAHFDLRKYNRGDFGPKTGIGRL